MGTFILLLEQDDDVRKLLVTFLTREGFPVLCAISPREAVHISAEYDKQIAVLITEELSSGDQNGLLPHLRAHNPGMRVLVTSPYVDEWPTDVVHLPKPFHLTALKQHLLAMFDD